MPLRVLRHTAACRVTPRWAAAGMPWLHRYCVLYRGALPPGVSWSCCCCVLCYAGMLPGMLRLRHCCTSCCRTLLPGTSRVVAWCVAMASHGMACHSRCVAVTSLLRIVLWRIATQRVVCCGMVHSHGVSWHGAQLRRVVERWTATVWRGVSCPAHVTVASLQRVMSWHVATQRVACCGAVHGCLLSGHGMARRGVYLLDVRTAAALLPAQPSKRKKKRKKRKRQLTMACGHLAWVCSTCALQPHCCLHNLVSERKKERKKAAHHGMRLLDVLCCVVAQHGMAWRGTACTPRRTAACTTR